MKAAILPISLIAAALLLSHQSAEARPKRSLLHSTTFTYKHRAVETHRQPIELEPQVTGVIPHMIQGGNPLQMLNPFAPEKYGTAQENTVSDPDVPGQGDGIKLFSISF
jgi:hypothetical protein